MDNRHQEDIENIASKSFNYLALRTLVGVITLALPYVVLIKSNFHYSGLGIPTSISATYHLFAQDVYIGMMFIIGAFLFAYKGHEKKDLWYTNVASLAVIVTALFPADCGDGWIKAKLGDEPLSCGMNNIELLSDIHLGAATVLFIILAYMCFKPFQVGTRHQNGKAGLRSKIYIGCGSVMVLAMVTAFTFDLVPALNSYKTEWKITFWVEYFALTAFGVSWLVAGKYFKLIADDNERLPYTSTRLPAKT